MTTASFRPRQDAGIPSGGEFKAFGHKEGELKLGRHSAAASSNRFVPESLRMAHFPDPNVIHELQWAVQSSVDDEQLADYQAENFSDKLPHLHYEESAAYFSQAQQAYADGGDLAGILEEAAAADTARHPGGSLADGYEPSITEHRAGYGQGVLSTGDKYTGYRNATDICKDIREELKKATAANYLPAGLKYSVTNDKFAGGQAVRVVIQGVSDADRTAGSTEMDRHGEIADLPEYKQLGARVESITDAYNRQDVDGQSDYFNVAYYSSVDVESDRSRAFREEEAAKRKAARAT